MKLRLTTLEDIDNIMGWVNDPEVLAKFANFSPVTQEQEYKFLESLLKSPNDKTYTVEKDDGKYIGQVSINKIYWPAANGRLSVVIHPKMRGSGYIRDAIRLITNKAWELGLHKIWLMLRVDNIKGQELYKSLGFTREAILIDEYICPRTREYVDMVRMYKLNCTKENR